MNGQNVVAARLGLPFKCGVCNKMHKKANLKIKVVCRCFVKALKNSLGFGFENWFSQNEDKLIRKPTFELPDSELFNVSRIHHSYPIEKDVFMLAYPVKMIIENLRKKFNDWENECMAQAIKLVEEKGQLNDVHVRNGLIVINGFSEPAINTDFLSRLMLKRREVAATLNCFWTYPIIDVEWKSLKKSAKVLIRVSNTEGEFTMFVSDNTGMVQVPNKIDSLREAENFIRKNEPCKRFNFANHLDRLNSNHRKELISHN